MVCVVVVCFYFECFCVDCEVYDLVVEVDVEGWYVVFDECFCGCDCVIVWFWIVGVV